MADRCRLPSKNLWLGMSIVDQATADERIPELLKCPAAVRFLSCEPLLGPIDLRLCPHPDDVLACDRDVNEDSPVACGHCPSGRHWVNLMFEPPWHTRNCGIDWVICGGESGPGARRMEIKWVRDIRDQCQAAGVPFFFKQHSGVHKKKAGRLLDGRTWDEMPASADELKVGL